MVTTHAFSVVIQMCPKCDLKSMNPSSCHIFLSPSWIFFKHFPKRIHFASPLLLRYVTPDALPLSLLWFHVYQSKDLFRSQFPAFEYSKDDYSRDICPSTFHFINLVQDHSLQFTELTCSIIIFIFCLWSRRPLSLLLPSSASHTFFGGGGIYYISSF